MNADSESNLSQNKQLIYQYLDDDLPSQAGAFEDLTEDVLALAQDYASEADYLRDQYD